MKAGIVGLPELMQKLKAVSVQLRSDAAYTALEAGAEIGAARLRPATPRRTGKAQEHIIIYRARQRQYGDYRVLVGYDKRAYYTYFLEEGWRAGGPHRLSRKGMPRAHSQIGRPTWARTIAPRKFAARAFEACKGEMMAAITAAYEKLIARILQ